MQEMIKISSKAHPNIELKAIPGQLLFGYDYFKDAAE